MSFLPSDDHMLIMNLSPHVLHKRGGCVSLTDEDLSRLRDVGAQTMLIYGIWHVLESNGWGYLDTEVALARKYGMRCLISSYSGAPVNFPKEWYSWSSDSTVTVERRTGSRTISLWNTEAQEALLGHIDAMINRYSGGDVAVIFAGRMSGETVLLWNGFYDPAALASHSIEVGGLPDPKSPETKAWVHRAVVAYFTKINGALLPHYNHTWNMMQPPGRDGLGASGSGAQEDILAAEYELWPDADRYLMPYTYWHHAGTGHMERLIGWRDQYKLQMIVEAGYCAGLPSTAPLAIATGMRGQLVCPVHPCAGTARLEQEHIDVIATAIRLWENA